MVTSWGLLVVISPRLKESLSIAIRLSRTVIKSSEGTDGTLCSLPEDVFNEKPLDISHKGRSI